MNMSLHKGFTLVELMVSIVLGLMVVAAATQLFLTAQRGVALQQGSSSLQNSASFGLEYILRDIRLANLRAGKSAVDPTTLHGGIVLSKSNLTDLTDLTKFTITNASADNSLMTSGEVGLSNLAGSIKSDQLVIQYRNTADNTYDCEGNIITPSDAYVVQRYFVRKDKNTNNDPNEPLSLACKATWYTGDSNTKLDSLSGDGEIIIPRVDHMHILFGVARDAFDTTTGAELVGTDGILDRFGYIKINDYMALNDKPQIVSIKLALLVRSPDTIGRNDLVKPNLAYKLYDIAQPLKVNAANNLYAREVVTQTVALRNGFGVQEETK